MIFPKRSFTQEADRDSKEQRAKASELKSLLPDEGKKNPEYSDRKNGGKTGKKREGRGEFKKKTLGKKEKCALPPNSKC